MPDAFSIARKAYRNQLFVLPITLTIPFVGPLNLTGYKLEMLIGQSPSAVDPFTIPPSGAPGWWYTAGGRPAFAASDVSVFPPDNVVSSGGCPPPAGHPNIFGTVLLYNATPTGSPALGQSIFSFSAANMGTLSVGTPYTWIYLVQPPGMDSSPACGGPLIIYDAPFIV